MISILMPIHNGVNFLQHSMRSVIKQTFADWELIIGVNGWRPHKAKKFVAKINERQDRIKAINLPNKGKVNALNELARNAKYDIICLLDVDDYWYPTKLEKQLPFMGKYDVVGTNAEYFGNIDGYPGIFLGELSNDMFSYQNPIINSSVMMKKSDAKWDAAWEGLDDYSLWCDMVGKGKAFYNVPEMLVKHRIHNRSYFNRNNEEMATKLKESMPKLDEQTYEDLTTIIDQQVWSL